MLLTRGASSYTNDANGNTLTGGGRTNTWDSQNRLAQCVNGANTSVFTYGADGQRHRMAVTNGGTTTTTDFILDGPMFVRERRNNANFATYLAGPRGPEYRRDDSTGVVRWYLYDGLGSCTGEVDPSGNITATRKYDVYGIVRATTGTSTTKHKFVGKLGHPTEDETGLIYMRARYYDPLTGRFASEDPAMNGSNWYDYTSSNPLNRLDQSGKSWYDTAWDIAFEQWYPAINLSTLFRPVAQSLLIFWTLLIAGDSVVWNPASRVRSGALVLGLLDMYIDASETNPTGSASLPVQIELFGVGYAAGLQLTMLILDQTTP